MGELDSFFLADGGQTPQSVADRLIDFIEPAKRTLQVAIYDFHAREGASSRVADALESARSRGVDVRVAYNTGRSEEVDEHRPMQCDPEVVDGLEVPTHGVHDKGALMHHKYVVRDGATVWTGSGCQAYVLAGIVTDG